MPAMAESLQALLRPATVGPLSLRNRVVMAPMTRSFAPGGVPGSDFASYFRRRAEQGVGLLLTGASAIDQPASSNDPKVPRFHGEDALAGWKRVVDEVHSAAGRIIPQLWHVGAVRRPGNEPNPSAPPLSPSGLREAGTSIGEPMSEGDIEAAVAAFAKGAAAAQRLGFDGVELHGGHGYLIDDFFWKVTNERRDGYGGDLRARTSFAVAVLRRVREAVGPGFPLLLRFSQWKTQDYQARLFETPQELETFLAPLVDAGVDLFDCSTRRFWEPAFEGSPLTLAGWTRKLSGRPSIAVGSVGLDSDIFAGLGDEKLAKPRFQDASPASLDRALELLRRGEFDLLAVGRALLADPAWLAKLREGRAAELVPFTRGALASLV
jgi:2,4-dienoyl-CoA reductase-like NADH-dependent reductase (Old Yellow Enzyme family)